MTFLFIWVIIVSIPNLVSSTGDRSTFSKNKDTFCTGLPFNIRDPPDIWLNVPNLSVDRVSLIAENFKAHVSLATSVANLVSLNTGVDVSMDKVNLTLKSKMYISESVTSTMLFLDVKTQVQLTMDLDNIAQIITRTLASLDLHPLLASITRDTFKSVRNLLSVFTDNGQLIYQIIDSGKVILYILSFIDL
jgi:hypothetical protein